MGPFYCVNDGVPPESIALLREACEARAVPFVEVEATRFAYDPAQRAPEGAALFRPAVSRAAQDVERFLWAPRVRTFHAAPDGPFRLHPSPEASIARAGVPTPAYLPCATAHRATLRGYVDRLGGLPLVAKTGGEGGVGVLRLDSLAALYAFADLAAARGMPVLLSAYIDYAEHWRVVVVGDRAVAAYRNRRAPDDFRSYPSPDAADYTGDVAPALAAPALAAARALDLHFGGVDVLVDAAGTPWVIECNFPCYYAKAQLVAGIDVAGAMVEWLTRAG